MNGLVWLNTEVLELDIVRISFDFRDLFCLKAKIFISNDRECKHVGHL